MSNQWSRTLIGIGLAAMIIAVVDPLEGAIVVLAGAALAAVGALLAARRPRLSYLAVALIAAGAGALWWLSALGGFGGDSGRSNWWALALLPYPVGWVIGVVSAARILLQKPRAAH